MLDDVRQKAPVSPKMGVGPDAMHSESGPPDLKRKNPGLPNIQVLPGCRSSYPLKGKKSLGFARGIIRCHCPPSILAMDSFEGVLSRL